jgi:hypothetical protein
VGSEIVVEEREASRVNIKSRKQIFLSYYTLDGWPVELPKYSYKV